MFKFSEYYMKKVLPIGKKYIHITSLSSQEKYIQNNSSSNLEKRRIELMQRGLPKIKAIENVKHIIMIASGKGGVGKSTTAVNLATSMKILAPDINIGLLDADIFGPSLPLMMNLHDTPLIDNNNNKQMIPLNNYGVKCMSMGFLIEEDSPVIWRGLMVMQAIEKLMRGVHWGPIDYLIIDTPPGTSDTHLSLIQNLPIAGVILVSTPQSAALQVTKRGAKMFQKLKVPIIGLVENMSSVKCPQCSNLVQLFGYSTETEQLATDINIRLLQKIPLESDLTKCCDQGTPVSIQHPNSELSTLYKSLASYVFKFVDNK